MLAIEATPFLFRSFKARLSVESKLAYLLFNDHRVVEHSGAMMVFLQEVDASNKDPVPVIVVGNKSDLTAERAVSYQEGEKVGG